LGFRLLLGMLIIQGGVFFLNLTVDHKTSVVTHRTAFYTCNRRLSHAAMYVMFLFFMAFCVFAWAQRVEIPINSQWRFAYYGSSAGAGAESVSFNDSAWGTVDLPHTWNALDGQDGGSNYARGFGWYRRHITISREYEGKRIYLFFESVGKKADVYCNGQPAGTHLGAYAAFCFDITNLVVLDADNVIAVRADNANTSSVSPLNIIPQSGDFNQWGGICRTVRLVITEPVHISPLDYASPGVYLTPTNVSRASADLSIKVLVRNTAPLGQTARIRATVLDADNIPVDTLQTDQILPQDSTQAVMLNTVISRPHLWNGRADPYLYKVIAEVEINGIVTDAVEQPLGFRYFSVHPDAGFFLNGQYLDLHGVAMHEDRQNKGRAISDADRQQDIELMLEMGCNWIRPSHYQHAETFYDLCDAKGIIVSSEIPIVNSITIGSADFDNNCKDQLRELIRQNYNHPSICFWLLYNELTTSGSENLIGQLHELAHHEDPVRLTTVAHNNTSDTAPWSYLTDTLAYNRYMGWYGGTPQGFAVWADTIHLLRSDDAVGIMEYGAGANPFQHEIPPVYPGPSSPWHPEEYQTYYHEVYWKAMKARPYLWCKTIWNGFDFAVDSRNEGGQPGLNDKGMVTRDRSLKKDAFYWYKANWTADPMVYITSRRFANRRTCPPYIKVYSNCQTVELFINGRSMGTKTASDCIFQWDGNIVLRPGSNQIRAVGTAGSTVCEDSCVWNLDVVENYAPASVWASHYESQNPPENTLDGSLGTRWAGNNYPWIKYDLGQIRQLQKIGIAFYLGNQRIYYFDIEASGDNVSWTTVLTGGQSSGTASRIEEFDIADTEARYIRIQNLGNTGPSPSWASFYEVEFYGHPAIDCAFMRSLHCGLAADLSGPAGRLDCAVNSVDFAEIARQWLDSYIETVVPAEPDAADLEAYWPLDGNYEDITGHHHASLASGSGTPVFVNPGRRGQAVDFDGASGLACADSTGIHLLQGGTVSAWIKSSNETDSWACVIAKGLTAWRLIRNDVGNTMCFHFNPASGTEFQANGITPVLDGQWHHVMAVYDGSRIRLYVDGQLDAAATTGGAVLRTNADPVYIGSRADNLTGRAWNGQIDEVRIYNRALTDSERLWLSEGDSFVRVPDPPRPADLVPDGRIDMQDLLQFIDWWMISTL